MPDATAVSRAVRRKLFEAGHVNAWVRDVVIALNGMYAGRTDEGSFEASGSSAALLGQNQGCSFECWQTT